MPTTSHMHWPWMSATLLMCVHVVSCSSALRNSKDAGTDGQGQTPFEDDVAAATPDLALACDVRKPFAAPLLVAGGVNQIGTNGAARFSPNELTAYISSVRTADAGGAGATDLYVAQRSQRTAAFAAAAALTGLNTSANEYDSTITGDGQTLYFGSSRSGVALIYVSLWNSGAASFSPPSILDSVLTTVVGGPTNPGLNTFQPYVLPDDNVLYFASSRDGGPDLYRSERGAAGFAPPVAIAELNTSFTEYYPTVAPDELVIYWGSDRTDGGARGGFDIWMATRASKSEPFANLRNVQELNTTTDEQPSWISPDGCRLYLSSRNAIYVAERSL